MVAIRNRNTNVPYLFRYPKWEPGIFYPAGAIVAVERPARYNVDSDLSFWNYYVTKYDVPPNDVEPPNDLINWAIFYDPEQARNDSEILQRLTTVENALDSDIKDVIEDYLAGDSDIYKKIAENLKDSELSVKTIFLGKDRDDSDGTAGGKITWNDDDRTVDLTLNGDVTLQVGQEQVFYGKAVGSIDNGDAVMFAGAQGDHLLFAKANLNSPGFKDEFIIGVATQSMANNEFGYVTVEGKVRGLNTSGFTEGALLYASPDDAGVLIDSEPVSPKHAILIAAVTRSHNNHGTIFVRPTFGKKLGQLQDVLIDNVQDSQMLAWNDSDGVWANTPSQWDYGSF